MEEKEVLALAKKLGISFSYIDRIYDSKEKRLIPRWMLLLPGAGCAWAKQPGGGCLMCASLLLVKQICQLRPFSAADMIDIFNAARSILDGSPKNLTIYNGGSFLNDEEIPLEAQLKICQKVRDDSNIKTLFVESRPEFITEDKIKQLIAELGKKQLAVGIGLECASDEVRDRCINKGLSKKDYEKAVKILKDNGADVSTYVFIKPLHLSEREAIDEAINTARYAFKIGTDEVAFEAAFVQRGTEMEKAYTRGEFRPPWLWSVLEVVKATHYLGRIRVGDFKDEPPPVASPYNCEQCSHKIKDLFQQYKENHQINVFDSVHCSCKIEWMREII